MENDLTKVCIFCERWESGGLESFLCNTLCAIDLQEYEIDIVVSDIQDSVFTEKLEKYGIHFVELSGKQQNIFKNHKMFRSLLRSRKYDVLYANVFQALSLCYVRIARQERIQVRVVHSHNTSLRASLTRPFKLLIHSLAKHLLCMEATELAACSEAAAKFMFPENLLNQKGYFFIPNGIDTFRFRYDPIARQQIRQELGIVDRFVIGNVGRLCFQKNQEFLIEMMPLVLKERSDSVLLLLGEGEALDELKAKTAKLNVENRVLFLGSVHNVERYLSAMDVFAFPSRFEGLGIAAVEAQASGLPTILSEFIPQEAILTELASVEKLDLKRWTEVISTLQMKKTKREFWYEQVKIAGFDITDTARQVNCLLNKTSCFPKSKEMR